MARMPDAQPRPVMTTVMIGQGRSVMHQIQTGTREVEGKTYPVMVNKTAMPGETIEVTIEDAAYLRSHGALHQAPLDTPPPIDRETVSGTRINGDDGSIVRAATS